MRKTEQEIEAAVDEVRSLADDLTDPTVCGGSDAAEVYERLAAHFDAMALATRADVATGRAVT